MLTLIDPKLADGPSATRRSCRGTRIKPDYRAWFDERMAVYAAMIEQMDRGVGEIVEAVEGTRRVDNTLVLFLSDNGGCAEEIDSRGPRRRILHAGRATASPFASAMTPRSRPARKIRMPRTDWSGRGSRNTPFRRYKSFVHEGGIATPLIVSWPGVVKPGITHEQGHVIDLMPTFLEAAGATYPARFGGRRSCRSRGGV